MCFELLSGALNSHVIKSTLSNLPVYFMSLFKIPVSMATQLEKIQRQFLWGDLDNKRKLHLVGLNSVAKGGLGIRRFVVMNAALLCKWWWRYGSEKQALWFRLLKLPP